VLVVEGYMDVVALAQFGVGYAVATLGTATTPFHLAKLLRLTDEIVFSFDGDSAGRKAAWRALEVALPAVRDGKPIRFLFLPEGDDPDSFVRANGREAFEQRVREAMPLSAFLLSELRAASDLTSAEGRSSFLMSAKPHLQKITAPALKLQLLKEVAAMGQVSQQEAESLLELSVSPAASRFVRPAPPRRQSATVTSPEQHLLRFVLNTPTLVRDVDFQLLDAGRAETRALHEIADWLEGGVSDPNLLVERFQGTELAGLVFETRASALERELSDEGVDHEFRQCLLELRIQSIDRELTELRSTPHLTRDMIVEMERRTRELSQLRRQRN